jgi:hypothetical protein
LRRLGEPLASVLTPLDSLHGLTSGGGLGSIATAEAALSRFSGAATAAGVPVKSGS